VEVFRRGSPASERADEAADYLAWLERALAELPQADAAALARLFQESEWQAPPPALVPLQELFEEAVACRRLLAEPLCRDPERQRELEETGPLLERSLRKTLQRLREGEGERV